MWTAVAGAVVGLGAGTALGVVETRRGEAHCREQPNHDMCGLEALAIPIYMLGGSVIGAVGGVFVEFDHWETVWTAEP
jgi:hypothetical protein